MVLGNLSCVFCATIIMWNNGKSFVFLHFIFINNNVLANTAERRFLRIKEIIMKNYEKAYRDRQRGMTYKDIAAKHGVSINTVKSWKTKQWKRIEEEKAEKDAQKAYKEAHTISAEEAAERIARRNKELAKKGIEQAQQASAALQAAKEMVKVKKASAPPAYSFEDTGKMIQKISNYFIICNENKKPYTRAGLILALGICNDTFYRYLNGKMDHLLQEHIAINNIDLNECDRVVIDDLGTEIAIDSDGNPLVPFSDVLQKALLRLEEQAESRLYWKGRPGDIFTMKQYGWTDENSAKTVNNTLVIASKEESDRALRMLYGDK